MAKASGTIDLKAQKDAHDDAEKRATNYITHVSDSGITVHPYGSDSNKVAINTEGMQVYQNNDVVAYYGTYARIGRDSAGNTYIDSNKIAMRNGSTELFTVSTGDGSVKVHKDINQKAYATTETIAGSFYLGRTISSLTKITVTYIASGTQYTVSYTSWPTGASNTHFSGITIGQVSQGGKTTVNYYLGPKSLTTILKSIAIEFVTTTMTTDISAGSYPDTTISSMFRLGNGPDASHKSNALSIDWDGTARFNGAVKVMCDSDSTGGITVGSIGDGGSYEWSAGTQSQANERHILISGDRWGPIVHLTIELSPWDISVAAGGNFINTTAVTGKLPVPIDNVSGVAYYGNRAIIATLWGDSSSLHFCVRNISSSAVTLDTDPLKISIVYLTRDA